MLKEIFCKIQQALQKGVKAHYGDRLVSVVFFGSAARGAQNYDSDLDFLIVCDDLPPGRMKRVKEFEEIENALQPPMEKAKQQGCHIRLSPIFKTRDEAIKGSPIFLDMVEDAEIAYDRDCFFANILAGMKKRLAALGARRVWRGNAWYWDLKPDFKPGEVFEI